jgi:hypothetical protein
MLDETAVAAMELQRWPQSIHYRHTCREEVPTRLQECQVSAISLNGSSMTTLSSAEQPELDLTLLPMFDVA